jgi:hypothetical protein
LRRKSPRRVGFSHDFILTFSPLKQPIFSKVRRSFSLSSQKSVLGKSQYGFFSQENLRLCAIAEFKFEVQHGGYFG